MATLLRESRSFIKARDSGCANEANHIYKKPPPSLQSKDSNSSLFQHFNHIRRKRKSRVDLSTGFESEQGVVLRQQREEELEKRRSITQLRRRLARKASTFDFHIRHRTSPQKELEKQRRSEHLFPEVGDDFIRPSSQIQNVDQPVSASAIHSEATETILNRRSTATTESANSPVTTVPGRRDTLSEPYSDQSEPFPNPDSIDPRLVRAHQQVLETQRKLAEAYPNYREKHYDALGVWSKMAAPSAEPPLPYEKLKQITVEACDSALANTNAYDHSKTAGWNTAIINTILAELVGETEPATSNGTSAAASHHKYKFVVNSTIVQHRSNTIDATTGKGSGRRGMHSAAGAFWNNEKDGMWSFKYEAAEKMGLDVVIGIVWIWVG